jgi:hypothetical protein
MKKSKKPLRQPNPFAKVLHYLKLNLDTAAEAIADEFHEHSVKKLTTACFALYFGMFPEVWFFDDIKRYLQHRGIDIDQFVSEYNAWYDRYGILKPNPDCTEKSSCPA